MLRLHSRPLVPLLALLAAGVLLPGRPPSASEGRFRSIDPATYRSPSGRWSLVVDPGERSGSGAATYRMLHDGRTRWSRRLWFTLLDAAVADDGTVGGYSYPEGVGFRQAKSLHVHLLAPTGDARLNHAIGLSPPTSMHGGPEPRPVGVFLDPSNDRLVVRFADPMRMVYYADAPDPDLHHWGETWWIFRISRPKLVGRIQPKLLMPDPGATRSIVAARPVPGTPLTLVHWLRALRGTDSYGARFTLIDLKGRPVWKLDLPADYSFPDDSTAQGRVIERMQREGAILAARSPGRFEVRFVKARQRVRFAVSRTPDGGWTALEEGRTADGAQPRPRVARRTVHATPAGSGVRLRRLGSFELRRPGHTRHPIRDVEHLIVCGPGRVAFIRDSAGEPAALVVVDEAGKTRAVSLAPIPADDRTWKGLAWLGGDRFVLVRSSYRFGVPAKLWTADVASGAVAPLSGYGSPDPDEIAGFGDGSFAVLGDGEGGNVLLRCAASGRRLWLVKQKTDTHDPLFAASGMTVTTDGGVVVCDNIRGLMQVYDGAGRHLRTVQLEKVWGRRPRYLSGLAPDREGGVIVTDFQAPAPFVRMRADDTVLASVTPRYPSGWPLDPLGVAGDGAGRLWTSDRSAVLRLDDRGAVVRVLGEAPDPARLTLPVPVLLDSQDRLYVVDGRTCAAHVFDRSGRWQRHYAPLPKDRWVAMESRQCAVTPSGEVLLGHLSRGGEWDQPAGYARYTGDGRRIGVVPEVKGASGAWLMQPRSGRRWVLGFRSLALVGPDGAILRKIDRRPDGVWLKSFGTGAVAPDGSLALLVSPIDDRDDPATISLYDPSGRPVRTLRVPTTSRRPYGLDYKPGLLVVGEPGAVLALDTSGRKLWRFVPDPGRREQFWTPLLPHTTHELWLFDGVRTIVRYALPPARG
jgi:hypothetical protein